MEQITRKITEQILRIETVYIAEDGKQFYNPNDCIEYERTKNIEKAKSTIEYGVNAEGMMPLDGYEHSESSRYYWFKPKNDEEFDLLLKAFDEQKMFDDRRYGKWICVEDCYGEYYFSYLEESEKYITELKKSLGIIER